MNLKKRAFPVLFTAIGVLSPAPAPGSDIVPAVLEGEVQTHALASLAKDNFNRNDTAWQTSASIPSAIGADWTVASESWRVAGHQLAMLRTAGGGILFWNAAKTANTLGRSFKLEFDVALGVTNATDFAGMAFNIQNATNYYALRYSGAGTVQLLRVLDGTPAVLDSGTFAHVAGHAYRLAVSSSQPRVFGWEIFDAATGTLLASGSATDAGPGFPDGYGGAYASSSAALLDHFRLQVDAPLPVAKTIQGVPILVQNEKPVPQDAFNANNIASKTILLEEIQKAGANGINLIFARGICASVDMGDGTFAVDAARLDTGIFNILSNHPNAQIVLSVGGLHPPDSWHAYYANETKLKEASGAYHPMPDPNSTVYLNTASNYLRGIVGHIEAQPYAASVVGYRIGVFEGSEFVLPLGYYGYSAATQTAFSNWLQQRYGSIGNLQAAWGDGSIASFDAATVPTVDEFTASDWGAFRNPQTRQKVVDFSAFWQEADADCLIGLCRAVKVASQKTPLVGAFYGYTLEIRQGFYTGHLALRKVLDSPYVDFLSAPYSYVYRSPVWLGAPDADISAGAFHGSVDSILSNGKIFYTEDDSRTYLTTDDAKSHFPDVAGTIANLRRNQLVNLCHGSGIWRLDLFGSGWYNSNELMLEMGLQKHLANLLLQEPESTGSYRPDVVLVVDEKSSFRVATIGATNPLPQLAVNMFLRDHLSRAGISYGTYLLSDLVAGRVPDCPVYLFAGTYDVSRTERNWIDENLKRDGKTLVWLYGSGLYDETGWGLDKMASLTGLDLAEAPDLAPSGIEPSSVLASAVANPGWDPTDIAGQPEWYVQNLPPGAQILANHVHGTLRRPAAVLANRGDWSTLYVGALNLKASWFLGIMRLIGVHQYLDTDALVPSFAGRGIVGIWPTEALAGTVRLKAPSDVYDLYSGELLHAGVSNFPVNLAQWEVAGFKIQPAGTNWVGGLRYRWQRAYFPDGEITGGLADDEADPDGDRFSNNREFFADTDPTNAASLLRASLNTAPAGTEISFETSPARSYFVSTSTDLVSNAWTPLGDPLPGTGGFVGVTDTNDLPQAFYRINARLP